MAASGERAVEELMTEAVKKSGDYEWMAASDLYRQALELVDSDGDPLEPARVTELLAKSYFKGAFQSETREEFRRKMQLSEVSYEKAAAHYERARSEAFSKRAKVRSLFATFWMKDDPADRRDVIGRCVALSEEAAQIFEHQRDKRSLAEAHKDLLTYFEEALLLSTDWRLLNEQFKRTVQVAEEAIREFEDLGEAEDLVETLHMMLWVLIWPGTAVLEPPRFRGLRKRIETLRSRRKNWGTIFALPS